MTSVRAPFCRAMARPFTRTRAQCDTPWMPNQSKANRCRKTLPKKLVARYRIGIYFICADLKRRLRALYKFS